MKSQKQVLVSILFSCLCFYSISQKISLTQALSLAIEKNPDLKILGYNVTMHEADTITAALRPNPIFNNQDLFLMNSSYFPAGSKMFGPKNRQTWYQITKQFVLPNQRKNKILLAHQNLVQEQKNYKESQRNILILAANQWVNVWYAQKQLDILKEAKQNLDSLVLINNLRYKNQVISHSDLMRVELLANQFSVKIKTAVQGVQNSIMELRYTLGGSQNIEVDTSDNLIFSKFNGINYDSLIRYALAYRSDIQVAKSTLDVAEANIKYQKTLALPVPELGFIFNPQNIQPYAGIYGTIVFPIFSRNQGEIKKSTIFKNQSEIALHANENLVQTELMNAYQMFKQQKDNVEKYNNYIQISDKILANVRYNYLAGGTNIVDYLEAQRSWIDTQQQFFEIQYNFRSSLLQMLFTAGIIQQLAQ